ncbi:MAG: hypothetical protein ACI8W8_002179 [Rhodothermales bacterium]|jgi:hypothetical protein
MTRMPSTAVTWKRGVFCILLIVLAIAMAARLRQRVWPLAQREIHDYDLCFSLKSTTRGYDIVIPGDSRVYRGVSPSAMRQVFPRARILNFGFSSGGLAPPLLDQAANALSEESNIRALVIGVTPFSLTTEAAANEHIKEHLQESQTEAGLQRTLALFGAFDPLVDPPTLALQGGGATQRFFRDGWVASQTDQENHAEGLRIYREHFARVQVSLEIQNAFMDTVASWRKQGIRIYAFRPPTCPEMVALEDEQSGFVEAEFVAAFTSAGGVWLPMPGSYHCYDGSHLEARAATAFSLRLATAVAEHMAEDR